MTIGEADASVPQANHARRIAGAKIGRGNVFKFPMFAVVGRAIGFNPGFRVVAAADGGEQFALT